MTNELGFGIAGSGVVAKVHAEASARLFVRFQVVAFFAINSRGDPEMLLAD